MRAYALTSYPPATGGAQLLQHQTARQLAARHSIQVVSLWDRNRTDWLLGTTLRAPSQPRDYVIDGIGVHRLGLGTAEKLILLPWVAAYYGAMSTALPPIAAALERHLLPYAAGADLVHNVRIGREGISLAALNTARQTGSAAGVAIGGSLIALVGLPGGVAAFMAVGAAAFLLGAVLTALCVPATR